MGFGFFKKKGSKAQATKQKNVDKFKTYLDMSSTFWRAGHKAEAIDQLEKALEIYPDRHDLWFTLGNYYDAHGSLLFDKSLMEKAENCLKKATQLKPDFPEAYYSLGNVVWSKDFRESVKYFEQAVKYDSQYQDALDRAIKLVEECTINLSKLNIYKLNSLREELSSSIVNSTFYFDDYPVGSAVFYSCTRSSKALWANAWLFSENEPNLFENEPVANITISSLGNIGVDVGTPSNYQLNIKKLDSEGLL